MRPRGAEPLARRRSWKGPAVTPARTATPFTLPPVKSVDDLLALAFALEREAANRYEQLSQEMERHRNQDVARLFRQLAAEEREHESHVEEWARRMRGAPPAPIEIRWKMPETPDEEQLAEAGGPFLLTPHKALAVAVENEERTFGFYVNVAAEAADEAVRELAEALAKEELNHVARLRLERRRAWRAERAAAEMAGEPPRRPPAETLTELLAAALEAESEAARSDAAAAEAVEARGTDPATAALLRRIAEDARRHASDLAAERASAGGRPARIAAAPEPGPRPPPAPASALEALRRSLKRTEESFELFAEVAEHATDEALLERAQRLAETAVSRLALIRSRISDLMAGPDEAGP